MTELSSAGQTLLDAADSEAKRLGLAATDFRCLVAAIARRADFEQVLQDLYGENFQQVLAEKQSGPEPWGDRVQLIGALEAAEGAQSGVASGLLQVGNPFREWLLNGEPAMGSTEGALQTAPPDGFTPDVGHEASPVNRGEAVGSRPRPVDPGDLVTRLQGRVLGQDEVIEQLVRRLAVTRAELDIRPERPDGAFLLVGPTGVGKTELALALAAELIGDKEALIRLDMSEYAHDWAISRLTGPMPGYVGSDQPQSWLTTKIRKKPETVLLLDEVEKAHPAVWNIFLQALDAGRLTDSKGKEADFSQVIVIMTSNLGSEAFTKAQVGFSDREAEEASKESREARAVQEEVRRVLPPELVNRLDAILNFRALEKDDIRRIAEMEVRNLTERLATRGIELGVPDEVTVHIAEAHYDRRYGARHLQRNIESLLVEPLAYQGITEGRVSTRLEGEEIVVEAG